MNGLDLLAFGAVGGLAALARHLYFMGKRQIAREAREDQRPQHDVIIELGDEACILDFKLASDLRDQRERTRHFRLTNGYRGSVSA